MLNETDAIYSDSHINPLNTLRDEDVIFNLTVL
jgi:hypothetical protein